MKNLVSICIPTYNGAQFIAEAMDSAISQTYPNLEIIVSDDASNDDTLKIVESYKQKTNIPIHVVHHIPSGIGANWNNCLKNANGTYIKFLFQDDILYPSCIDRMVSVLANDKSLAILACKRHFRVEESFKKENYLEWISRYENLQSGLSLEQKKDVFYIDKTLFKNKLFFKSPLNKIGEPTTLLFRKELIESIGYFNTELKQVLDYEFCYRVLPFARIGILEEALVEFRLHDAQTTVKNKIGNLYEKDFFEYQKIIYKKYLKYLKPKDQKKLMRMYSPMISRFYNSVDVLRRLIRR